MRIIDSRWKWRAKQKSGLEGEEERRKEERETERETEGESKIETQRRHGQGRNS